MPEQNRGKRVVRKYRGVLTYTDGDYWYSLPQIASSFFTDYEGIYRINSEQKYLDMVLNGHLSGRGTGPIINLSTIVHSITQVQMGLISFDTPAESIVRIENDRVTLTAVSVNNAYSFSKGTFITSITAAKSGFARVYYDYLA